MSNRAAPIWQQSPASGSVHLAGPFGGASAYTARNRVFGKISGTASATSSSGQTAWCWQQVRQDDNGVFTLDDFGLASAGVCTPTITNPQPTGYAWDLNGRTDIPTNTIVELEPTGAIDAAGDSWRILYSKLPNETGKVYGRANSSPALPGHGPRRTINLKDGSNGLTTITIVDDPTDDELEWTITANGINVRVNSTGSTHGPRPRLNFIRTTPAVGNNLSISAADDVGDSEIDVTFENLGMFARNNGGTTVGPQPRFNFLSAANGTLTWTVANDPVETEIDITPAVVYQMSITADGSGLKLSGDQASPGNTKYYGTNGSGVKGWYDAAGISLTVTDTDTINLTLSGSNLSADARYQMSITADTSGLKFVNDETNPTHGKFYGITYVDGADGVKKWCNFNDWQTTTSLSASDRVAVWDAANSRDKTIRLDDFIQAALDAISTSHGAIIYRGASDWSALTGGTNGYQLTTHGVGAAPTWELA